MKNSYTIYPTSQQHNETQNLNRSLKFSTKVQTRSQYYDERLQSLHAKIHMMQKKYKENLKDGFENKIKSFRLEAVMDRKIIQATVSETKRDIEIEELTAKAKRAQSMKKMEEDRLQFISYRIAERAKKAKAKADKQKSCIEAKIKNDEQKLVARNKEAHNKVLEDSKFIDRKKKYFESLRVFEKQKGIEQQKTKLISKIIENKQTLKSLKYELLSIPNTPRTTVDTSTVNNRFLSTPFITI